MRALVLLALCVLAALLPFGCGSVSRVVVRQHPQTKQTVECKVDPWGSTNRTAQIEDCVKAYRQAGYMVVGDSE